MMVGAWGCGASRNPPMQVARAFVRLLEGPEFRGVFRTVVFPIIDPLTTDSNWGVFHGVITKFVDECATLEEEQMSEDDDAGPPLALEGRRRMWPRGFGGALPHLEKSTGTTRALPARGSALNMRPRMRKLTGYKWNCAAV